MGKTVIRVLVMATFISHFALRCEAFEERKTFINSWAPVFQQRGTPPVNQRVTPNGICRTGLSIKTIPIATAKTVRKPASKPLSSNSIQTAPSAALLGKGKQSQMPLGINLVMARKENAAAVKNALSQSAKAFEQVVNNSKEALAGNNGTAQLAFARAWLTEYAKGWMTNPNQACDRNDAGLLPMAQILGTDTSRMATILPQAAAILAQKITSVQQIAGLIDDSIFSSNDYSGNLPVSVPQNSIQIKTTTACFYIPLTTGQKQLGGQPADQMSINRIENLYGVPLVPYREISTAELEHLENIFNVMPENMRPAQIEFVAENNDKGSVAWYWPVNSTIVVSAQCQQGANWQTYQATLVHEMSHKWSFKNMSGSDQASFEKLYSLSRSKAVNGSDRGFANDYGKTSVAEDYATVSEEYIKNSTAFERYSMLSNDTLLLRKIEAVASRFTQGNQVTIYTTNQNTIVPESVGLKTYTVGNETFLLPNIDKTEVPPTSTPASQSQSATLATDAPVIGYETLMTTHITSGIQSIIRILISPWFSQVSSDPS